MAIPHPIYAIRCPANVLPRPTEWPHALTHIAGAKCTMAPRQLVESPRLARGWYLAASPESHFPTLGRGGMGGHTWSKCVRPRGSADTLGPSMSAISAVRRTHLVQVCPPTRAGGHTCTKCVRPFGGSADRLCPSASARFPDRRVDTLGPIVSAHSAAVHGVDCDSAPPPPARAPPPAPGNTFRHIWGIQRGPCVSARPQWMPAGCDRVHYFVWPDLYFVAY